MTSIVDFSITIWVVVIPIALLGGFFFNWRKSVVTYALLCVTAGFFLIIQPNLRVSVVDQIGTLNLSGTSPGVLQLFIEE